MRRPGVGGYIGDYPKPNLVNMSFFQFQQAFHSGPSFLQNLCTAAWYKDGFAVQILASRRGKEFKVRAKTWITEANLWRVCLSILCYL